MRSDYTMTAREASTLFLSLIGSDSCPSCLHGQQCSPVLACLAVPLVALVGGTPNELLKYW